MGGDFPACIYWWVKRNPWESVKVAGGQWACRGWHPVRQEGATKKVANMTGRPWDHITTACKRRLAAGAGHERMLPAAPDA